MNKKDLQKSIQADIKFWQDYNNEPHHKRINLIDTANDITNKHRADTSIRVHYKFLELLDTLDE